MANTSAKYTDEYRRKTADYIISTGRLTTEVCRELGAESQDCEQMGEGSQGNASRRQVHVRS